jgi:sporulation integral membrane protein YlbJ
MAGLSLFCACAVYALALLCFPAVGAQAVREGLSLCGRVLLPALFPYLVLSHLLVGAGAGERLGRALSPLMSPLFHVGGAGAAALALGSLGGYPTVAAVIRSLLERGSVSLQEAQALLCFCNNAGPAFALSVAGAAVMGDIRIGAVLLGVHLCSALLCGILLRPKACAAASPPPPRSPRSGGAGALLTDSVGKAMSACLHISAFVVFFQVLTALLEAALPLRALPVPVSALLRGLLELSGGISSLSGLHTAPALAVCAFLLGWGGCSVHCQTAALLSGTGLSLAPYLRAKLLHGLLSAAMVLPFSRLLPALSPAPELSALRLFPASVALGWVIWTVTALALLRREGCNSPEA